MEKEVFFHERMSLTVKQKWIFGKEAGSAECDTCRVIQEDHGVELTL